MAEIAKSQVFCAAKPAGFFKPSKSDNAKGKSSFTRLAVTWTKPYIKAPTPGGCSVGGYISRVEVPSAPVGCPHEPEAQIFPASAGTGARYFPWCPRAALVWEVSQRMVYPSKGPGGGTLI